MAGKPRMLYSTTTIIGHIERGAHVIEQEGRTFDWERWNKEGFPPGYYRTFGPDWNGRRSDGDVRSDLRSDVDSRVHPRGEGGGDDGELGADDTVHGEPVPQGE